MVTVSLDPPPFARKGRRRPRGGRRLLLTFFWVTLLLVGFLAGRWTAPGGRLPITLSRGAAVGGAPASTVAPAGQTTSIPAAPSQTGQAPVTAVEPLPGTPGALAPVEAPAPRRLTLTLAGPLEDAITAALPPSDRGLAEPLTQVVNRLLVWDLRVSRDGRRGDTLQVVYRPPGGVAVSELGAAEPVVEALRYDSQKLSAVITAYRFQVPGARWARYYRADGTEVEERLVDAPIGEYEQVTSLLRDGRRHRGVDFRVPVGSPVFATFDGVIARRNWNFAGNGNCLDVRDPETGLRALYLHLDELPRDMVPGRRVRKGEQIASSGNSGRSFGPHLHYQLEGAGGQVLDPFETQPVRRASLDPGARADFDRERTRLEAALLGNTVTRTAAAVAPPAPPPPPAAAQ